VAFILPYPTAPPQLIEPFSGSIAISHNAVPLNQRIKSGVEQTSIAGEINLIESDRTLTFWVKTADYGTVYSFFDVLHGKPFRYQGTVYRVKSESWKASSAALWELSLSVTQVFNPG
jgi:hypothetical protein